VILAVGGVAAAVAANARPDEHGGTTGGSCPRGSSERAVPVSGYTLWACAKPGASQPGPTVTVTQPPTTVTVTPAGVIAPTEPGAAARATFGSPQATDR